MKPIFIAEIKTQSPYGFRTDDSFVKLMDYAIQYGDWISVHTNPLWGGSLENIEFVKQYTDKPILAKGIHSNADSILRAFDMGANYVLTTNPDIGTASAPEKDWFKLRNWENYILFEGEFDKIEKNIECNSFFKLRKYVCNSRDLRTGKTKDKNELENFRKLGVWTCQASGIQNKWDVNPNVNAYIVGTHLIQFCQFGNYYIHEPTQTRL